VIPTIRVRHAERSVSAGNATRWNRGNRRGRGTLCWREAGVVAWLRRGPLLLRDGPSQRLEVERWRNCAAAASSVGARLSGWAFRVPRHRVKFYVTDRSVARC
jgi:hypothetical protein